MTKQFTAEAEGVVYLDFSALRSGLMRRKAVAAALWVIEAERARRPYGLRLPGTKIIPPGIGQVHFISACRYSVCSSGSARSADPTNNLG